MLFGGYEEELRGDFWRISRGMLWRFLVVIVGIMFFFVENYLGRFKGVVFLVVESVRGGESGWFVGE